MFHPPSFGLPSFGLPSFGTQRRQDTPWLLGTPASARPCSILAPDASVRYAAMESVRGYEPDWLEVIPAPPSSWLGIAPDWLVYVVWSCVPAWSGMSGVPGAPE